jgi:transposase-like protein
MTGSARYTGNHCLWCNASLTPHQTVTTKSCGAPKCERERTAELARAQTARRAKEHEDLKARLSAEHSDWIAKLARKHGVDETDLRVMVTPFNEGRLSVLPDDRREALEAHLTQVAEEGFAIEDPETLSWPNQRKSAVLPEPEVADAACATCQGGCCRPGGPSWGFIGKEEVCRYRLANPDATAQDFRQYYLDHLPERSVTDSCVFQSNTGCTLSRQDRSTLCNTFLCRGVKTMLAERSRDGEAPTIVIAEEYGIAYNLGMHTAELGWVASRLPEPPKAQDE